jgi:hypothetical protein
MYRRHLPLLLALLSPTALGQSFVQNTTDIPTGSPGNNSTTENVDFADVDSDGDLDALFADGGNDGNDRNRLWINLGGLQGGTVGVFDDQTGTRLPVGTSTSRDVEFVDIDGDGDVDVYTSNTSTASNQTNRWWVNQGGLQAGTAGFFVDETATRWINLGQNNGSTTFSSVPMSFVLPAGAGFIDWSCDCDFADLDNDGDQDLIHASYGDVFGGATPTRLFLNDGGGLFEEYNPSGFQLTSDFVLNGNPALWASGTQQASTMASNGTGASTRRTRRLGTSARSRASRWGATAGPRRSRRWSPSCAARTPRSSTAGSTPSTAGRWPERAPEDPHAASFSRMEDVAGMPGQQPFPQPDPLRVRHCNVGILLQVGVKAAGPIVGHHGLGAGDRVLAAGGPHESRDEEATDNRRLHAVNPLRDGDAGALQHDAEVRHQPQAGFGLLIRSTISGGMKLTSSVVCASTSST